MYSDSKCFVALPRGGVGKSAVSDLLFRSATCRNNVLSTRPEKSMSSSRMVQLLSTCPKYTMHNKFSTVLYG